MKTVNFKVPDFIAKAFATGKIVPENVTDTSSMPKGRASTPAYESDFASLKESLKFVKEDFYKSLIPYIRRLLALNSSLSLAVIDSVQLCNTGYSIEFGHGTDSEEIIKMREHLEKVGKTWGAGTAGLFGLINKQIYQIFIGGALSTEWVIKRDLSGIQFMAMVRPEDVRAAFNRTSGNYQYYQVVKNGFYPKSTSVSGDRKKLNDFTYRYYELVNDLEEPQGIPPFLSALLDLKGQKNILDNINLVSDQYGLMGFLQLLLKKPGRKDGETDQAFTNRLTTLAKDSKESVLAGLKDGVVVGYQGDHEFDFMSVAKNASGLSEVFDINHRMVANGLLTSPGFQGGAQGGSETDSSIIFTKMLSQMETIQNMVRMNMNFALWLELTLAGFKFNNVYLKFDESTITDSLKNAQVNEIKIRNARILYADGIYSQEQYANHIGLDKPDMDEPRVEIDPAKIAEDVAKRKAREDGKDTSDRKVREKNKPQPKRKDQKTK